LELARQAIRKKLKIYHPILHSLDMEEVLVSVVIPAFNSSMYISECIDSVLAQSYKNLEIIVVDDGSSDNTESIVKSYNETAIRFFSQRNSGSAIARNFAVEKANGEWLAFIDSDDIWHPEKLTSQFSECFDKYWSHTDYYYLSTLYPEYTRATDFVPKHSGDVFKQLLLENTIATSTVMIRKEIFEEFGGYNPDLKALQDWDLWLRVAEKYEICYLDIPLMSYRIHSGSVSRSTRKTFPYHISLINRYFAENKSATRYKALKNKALSQSSFICSQISEQEKDYTFSCYCATKSVIYQPLNFSRYTRLTKLLVKSALFYMSEIGRLIFFPRP
jgi:glycosyltransferase involved in cell wall biosynthesis